MSKAPLPAEVQAGKQMSREQSNSRVPTAQAQPIQEEASGYASTESDSDTGTNDRVQVCLFCLMLSKGWENHLRAILADGAPVSSLAEEAYITWCPAYQGLQGSKQADDYNGIFGRGGLL